MTDAVLQSTRELAVRRPKPPPQAAEVQQRLMLAAHLGIDVLGYGKLCGLHMGWLAEVFRSPRLLFLAPRSHFKTTCITELYPILRILEDRSVRILIINEILENAKGFLREIKAGIQSEKFVKEFGKLDDLASRWSETAIALPSSRVSKDPTVGVAGTMGTIVSRHADLIILDDPVSYRNSQTPRQRHKLMQWFLETVLPILEPDGQLIVTGTRWHNEDMYGEILKPKKFKTWRKIVLKAEWKDAKGQQQILFPERFTPAALEELRTDMGEAYYNSQYLNDPSKLAGQRFKFDWLAFYETEPARMRIFQGVDLAISKKDDAAYFALVTIGIPPEGDIYLLDYVHEKIDFNQQCAAIKSALRSWKPDIVGIESVAYQESMPQWLRADPEAKRVPFKSLPASGDKIARLTSLGPLFEQGVIKVRASQHAFIDEYLAFPRSGTFDLLDALLMAIETSRDQVVESNMIEVEL